MGQVGGAGAGRDRDTGTGRGVLVVDSEGVIAAHRAEVLEVPRHRQARARAQRVGLIVAERINVVGACERVVLVRVAHFQGRVTEVIRFAGITVVRVVGTRRVGCVGLIEESITHKVELADEEECAVRLDAIRDADEHLLELIVKEVPIDIAGVLVHPGAAVRLVVVINGALADDVVDEVIRSEIVEVLGNAVAIRVGGVGLEKLLPVGVQIHRRDGAVHGLDRAGGVVEVGHQQRVNADF